MTLQITAYNLRSTDINPEPTGDLLTQTSEPIVKRLTLQSLRNTVEHNQKMPDNVQDSAKMIYYCECLSNLKKFNGGEEQKILQFINNIERIGNLINANDDILHCMCTVTLDEEAKRWYENNMSLIHWESVKLALLERFTTSNSPSKIFEQLKERKQKSDETIASYYDAIIKLCHEYDPSMSQKMMISWLENGIKDSLKIQIKRQMKSFHESARTTQAFLKIAKDEQELQEEKKGGGFLHKMALNKSHRETHSKIEFYCTLCKKKANKTLLYLFLKTFPFHIEPHCVLLLIPQ